MARGKWFLPYRKNRLNYEDIGAMPYLVQHDIGFSGDELFRPLNELAISKIQWHVMGPSKSRDDAIALAKHAVDKMHQRLRINPGKGWFTRCVEGVRASGSAMDPGAVCGAELKRMGYSRRNPVKVYFASDDPQDKNRTHAFRASSDEEARSVVKRMRKETGRKLELFGASGRKIQLGLFRNAGLKSVRKTKKFLKKIGGSLSRSVPTKKGWGAPYTRTRKPNPAKRYEIRAAGRIFTVSAKTQKAARAEVARYCRQHGLKMRNPVRRRNRKKSVSMLVPRSTRRTIRSTERRVSGALQRYLGGRR